uniref:General transcription factor IIH subunit n=1 Tax=Culicoides sonorensis TaxID=179676 RepID=A0A336K9I8_CULSO
MDEEDPKEYRWETGYEKTWEAIKEDDDGLVASSVADIIQKAKRRRLEQKKKHCRLGMMRHLFIIVDCTENMSQQDLKPTRLMCTLKLLEMFIEEYFDQNPISQLGIIAMKNKRAEKLTELAGSSRKHIKAVQALNKIPLTGEPSLQNGLELALKSLKMLPSHASREILVIMGSLTTCDPGDILTQIESLKAESIRSSFITLSAEIHICKVMCNETGGVFGAIMDDAHFKDQLFQHVEPPPAAFKQEFSLIKMGFPHGQIDEGKNPPLTMCMCHIDSTDEPSKLNSGGYHCPQCLSKYCEIPVECISCGLTLVSAPHLARSYHHLFPVLPFKEVTFDNQVQNCYACQKMFNAQNDKIVYECEKCKQIYCTDCDIYIHETLHSCVGCTTIPTLSHNRNVRRSSNFH